MSPKPRSLLSPISAAPAASRVKPAPALLEKGFRPFFLLAAAFAALAVPLWVVALRSGLAPGGAFGPMQWHAHEMIFGFTSAVIAGFLLTAIARWTNLETLRGALLGALALLWVAGRVTVFFAGDLPAMLPVTVDLAFSVALVAACARPVLASKNRRNYAFLVMLGLLGAANFAAHFGAVRGELALVRTAHFFAADVIGLMIVVMTGRIVPMFTRGGTGVASIRGIPKLEWASALGFVGLIALNLLPVGPSVVAGLSALVALLLLARMRFWGSHHTAREPLLWILHAGVLWLPLALIFRALAALGVAGTSSAALHALTAGAIGSLTLGMMARVSLGHTGRLLKAPRTMGFAFAAVVLAGFVRVSGVFLPTALYLRALEVAAVLWSLAFGSFCVAYFRVLTSPSR